MKPCMLQPVLAFSTAAAAAAAAPLTVPAKVKFHRQLVKLCAAVQTLTLLLR
jgi:hypothetical protein